VLLAAALVVALVDVTLDVAVAALVVVPLAGLMVLELATANETEAAVVVVRGLVLVEL